MITIKGLYVAPSRGRVTRVVAINEHRKYAANTNLNVLRVREYGLQLGDSAT